MRECVCFEGGAPWRGALIFVSWVLFAPLKCIPEVQHGAFEMSGEAFGVTQWGGQELIS